MRASFLLFTETAASLLSWNDHTFFFQKGTIKCTELFEEGFMIPQHAAVVKDVNRSPETKSTFRFKFTAE